MKNKLKFFSIHTLYYIKFCLQYIIFNIIQKFDTEKSLFFELTIVPK